MSWLGVAIAVVLMVAAAAGYEAWAKRGKRRPLSSHAANQRRWDDPHRPGQDQDHHLLTADHVVGRLGLTGKREWRFPKDPQEQAKALMPERAKSAKNAKTKDKDNE